MVTNWKKDISSRNNDTSKNKWGLALEDAGYERKRVSKGRFVAGIKLKNDFE